MDSLDLEKFHHQVLMKDCEMGVLNRGEYLERDHRLAQTYGRYESLRYPIPSDHKPLILKYPANTSFFPDYFIAAGATCCSAVMRAAMNLPPDVVQYTPLKCVGDDPRLLFMGYQLMRVLAVQDAFDIDASSVTFKQVEDHFIGGWSTQIRFYDRLVLRPGFQPQSDLFRAAELPQDLFATDALAERVMRAGCVGIEFSALDAPDYTDQPSVIRTARGAEFRSRATRRNHLRHVARVRGLTGQGA
jgi:hypothetical protein